MARYAWLLGLRGLWQHGRRNLTSGSAIAVGYVALLFMIGYAQYVQSYLGMATIYVQQSGHVTIFKKDGLRRSLVKPRQYSLSSDEFSRIKDLLAKKPEVEIVAPFLLGFGLAGNGCDSVSFAGRGLDVAAEQKIRRHPEIMRFIPELSALERGQPLWEAKTQNQVALSKGLAKRLGKSSLDFSGQTSVLLSEEECKQADARDRLAQDPSLQLLTQNYEGRLSAVEVSVGTFFSTGVLSSDENTLFAPLPIMQELFQTDQVSQVAVFLKNPSEEELSSFLGTLREDFSREGLGLEAYAWNDIRLNPSYVTGTSVMYAIIGFVAMIIGFVVLLSLLNTLTIGLAEARKEIGTLLALGYRPSNVAAIFLVEGFAVTILALGVGAVLMLLLVEALLFLKIPQQYPGLSYVSTFISIPSPAAYIIAALALTSLVMLASFSVVRRFARQSILILLDRGG